jgi:hypothetical protein
MVKSKSCSQKLHKVCLVWQEYIVLYRHTCLINHVTPTPTVVIIEGQLFHTVPYILVGLMGLQVNQSADADNIVYSTVCLLVNRASFPNEDSRDDCSPFARLSGRRFPTCFKNVSIGAVYLVSFIGQLFNHEETGHMKVPDMSTMIPEKPAVCCLLKSLQLCCVVAECFGKRPRLLAQVFEGAAHRRSRTSGQSLILSFRFSVSLKHSLTANRSPGDD